ncbi:MAG: hypothetical protein OEZ02_04270 [Anaerolineae bacterium]|nr:hypothetical protein [Anaerolineae bacterium]
MIHQIRKAEAKKIMNKRARNWLLILVLLASLMVLIGNYLSVKTREVITAENFGEVTELQRLGLGSILELDISPDDSMLAVASTTGIQVYELKTFTMLFQLSDSWSERVDWSPDSQRLASVHYDGTLKLWDVPKRKLEASKQVVNDRLKAVAWSPDGKMIVIASGELLTTLNAGTLDIIKNYDVPRIEEIVWTTDNHYIALNTGYWGLSFLNLENGEVNILNGENVQSIIGDDIFVNGNNTGALVVMYRKESRELISGDGFSKRLFRVDGQGFLYSSWPSLIKYTLAKGESETLLDYDKEIFSMEMDWTTDMSIIVSGGVSGNLTIVDTSSGEILGNIPDYYCCFEHLAWSPKNNQLGISTRTNWLTVHNIFIWDLFSNEVNAGKSKYYEWSLLDKEYLKIHYVSSMAWQFGEDLLLSNRMDFSDTLFVWNPFSGKVLFEGSPAKENYNLFGEVILSTDGKYLAYFSRSPSKLIVIEIRTGETILTQEIKNCGEKLFWSPDSKLIAISKCNYNGVEIWDVDGGAQISSWELENMGKIYLDMNWRYELDTLAWSSDSAYLASRNRGGDLRVWNASTGNEIYSIEAKNNIVHFSNAAAWSPAALLLAYNLPGGLALWDMETNTQVALIDNFDGGIQSIVWSADGTQFATIGDDHTIRIWGIP